MIDFNANLHEKLVRQVEEMYDTAWKNSDLEGLLACLTKDAIIINPSGEVANGHRQISDLVKQFWSTAAKNTIHTSQIKRISFIGGNVAIVDGEAFITGDSKELTPHAHHRFTDILVYDNEVWLIAHIRACRI